MSQDANRKWTRGWTSHLLHNFHWFDIPIFFGVLTFLWSQWQCCYSLSFATKLHVNFHFCFYLVLMEMQISFHMACSMPLYPLGKGKKKARNVLLRNLDSASLHTCVSTAEDRALCRGKFRHRNLELLYLSLLPLNMMGWRHKRRLGFHYLYSK